MCKDEGGNRWEGDQRTNLISENRCQFIRILKYLIDQPMPTLLAEFL